jgi:hypothetical protein
MEFSYKFSKHRRVAHWMLETDNLKIYSRDIEGKNLSGVWRLTTVNKKPILNRKIRYLDEEILSALKNGQKARLAFLTYLWYIWDKEKKFLHLRLD